MSQEELSFLAALHRTEVSQLERGLRVPRIDTIVKLAGSLKASTDELLVGIEWEPSQIQRGGFSLPQGD